MPDPREGEGSPPTVDASHAQGVQVGDHSYQSTHFDYRAQQTQGIAVINAITTERPSRVGWSPRRRVRIAATAVLLTAITDAALAVAVSYVPGGNPRATATDDPSGPPDNSSSPSAQRPSDTSVPSTGTPPTTSIATAAHLVEVVELSVSIGSAPSCTATVKATVRIIGGPLTVDLAYKINGSSSAKSISFTGTGSQSKQVTLGTGDGTHNGNVDAYGTVTGASKSTSWTAPAQCVVVFTGTAANPTVTVNGSDFGSWPAGTPWNNTSCGGYADNGKDYGPQLRFVDVGYFAAGNGACIGIKVLSWSATRVVFQFCNSYKTFDHWYVTAGDSYDITLVGQKFIGTIAFS